MATSNGTTETERTELIPSTESERRRGRIDQHPHTSPNGRESDWNLRKNCWAGLQGGHIYIVLGLITLAIIFSIMTETWTKMIYTDKEATEILLVVLLVSVSVGIVSITILMALSRRCNGSLKCTSPYEVVKIVAFYVFGILNIAHCILFTFKHANGSSGCTYWGLGIAYNVLSIIYTILLMIGLCCVKVSNDSVCQRFFSMGVLIANFSFWLDTFFSESSSIFNHGGNNTLPLNHSNISVLCKYTNESINYIEKLDPVFSVGTAEFAITTVDLLFSTEHESIHVVHSEGKVVENAKTECKNLLKSYNDTMEEGVSSILDVTQVQNVVAIIVAAEQTLFILAIEDSEKMSQNNFKNNVYNVCKLLCSANFGLWLGDSFGVSKLPILTVIIRRNYNETFWIVFTKLVLPITIFFRIHSALIFLKMFYYRESLRQENNDQHVEPPTINDTQM